MKLKDLLVLSTACLLLSTCPLLAQDAEDLEEEEIPEATYSIKTISLSLFGGVSTGATFFELPSLEDRTQLQEGSNDVYRYDGTIFELPDYYDAPEKKIETGQLIGGRVGFYLSDEFHLDIVASLTRSKAITSFLNRDPRNERNFREDLDEDPNFTSYMGGFNLSYDVNNVKLLGFTPFFGAGIGGIINTFEGLPDKTALYFRLTAGMTLPLSKDYWIYTQFDATTFSFGTEELQYGKQVTYATAMLGLTWAIDVTP